MAGERWPVAHECVSGRGPDLREGLSFVLRALPAGLPELSLVLRRLNLIFTLRLSDSGLLFLLLPSLN